jgi:hypothetical protein
MSSPGVFSPSRYRATDERRTRRQGKDVLSCEALARRLVPDASVGVGGVRFRVALLNAATRTDEPLSRATVKLSKQSRSFSSSDYGLSIRSSELGFGI